MPDLDRTGYSCILYIQAPGNFRTWHLFQHPPACFPVSLRVPDIRPLAVDQETIDVLTFFHDIRKKVLCEIISRPGDPFHYLRVANIYTCACKIAENLSGPWLLKEPVDPVINIKVRYTVITRVIDREK